MAIDFGAAKWGMGGHVLFGDFQCYIHITYYFPLEREILVQNEEEIPN